MTRSVRGVTAKRLSFNTLQDTRVRGERALGEPLKRFAFAVVSVIIAPDSPVGFTGTVQTFK